MTTVVATKKLGHSGRISTNPWVPSATPIRGHATPLRQGTHPIPKMRAITQDPQHTHPDAAESSATDLPAAGFLFAAGAITLVARLTATILSMFKPTIASTVTVRPE